MTIPAVDLLDSSAEQRRKAMRPSRSSLRRLLWRCSVPVAATAFLALVAGLQSAWAFAASASWRTGRAEADSKSLRSRSTRGSCSRIPMAVEWSSTPAVPVAPAASLSGTASDYRGVMWHSRNHKWQAFVEHPEKDGVTCSLGLFGSEQEAAEAYDKALLLLKGASASTNFPAEKYSKTDLMRQNAQMEDLWRPRPSAQYYGVYQTGTSTRWKAEVDLYGTKQLIDFYDDEEEAAKAVDKAIRGTGAEKVMQLQFLNFKEDSDYFHDETWEQELIPRGASSRFLGVSYHQRSDKYLARMGRKHIGLFESEVDAAKAFDKVSAAGGGPTNFKPARLTAGDVIAG
eukprot:TRINITY_DN19318_c0_g1_i1.p1 TRINITY_DN19318_c0_g1~~TRINITY_DN19318_c0_g1_i1.p1  ORF type:complete len:343 (-),score=85.50 TRINITY_DN19318_c0_g1_i1:60-1088(-)